MMRPRNGYILVLTLLIATAILFFAFSYVELYRGQARLARLAENDMIAAAAAGAGIDEAIFELKRNHTWTSGFQNVLLPHSGAAYSMSFIPNQPLSISIGFLTPSSRVIPFSTNNSAGPLSVTGYGGRIVAPGMADLISVGTFATSVRIEEAIITTAGGVIAQRARW